jgi:hypothetical protein
MFSPDIAVGPSKGAFTPYVRTNTPYTLVFASLLAAFPAHQSLPLRGIVITDDITMIYN